MNFFQDVLNWLRSMSLGLLSRLLPAVIIAVVGFLLIQLVMKVLDSALAKSKLEKAAFSLVKTLVKVVMLVLLGLIVASKLGLDVTGIITSSRIKWISSCCTISSAWRPLLASKS